MSGSRCAAVLVSGAVVVAALVALLVWRTSGDDAGGTTDRSGGAAAVVTDVGPATAPFTGWTAGTIRVGSTTLSVVVADDGVERVTGLRGREDAAPYDGMLFVFGGDTTTPFTMATVPAPLDIAFYASDGSPVDRLRMEPCVGTDVSCPAYRASGPFRYALETAPRGLPSGRLRVAVTPSS